MFIELTEEKMEENSVLLPKTFNNQNKLFFFTKKGIFDLYNIKLLKKNPILINYSIKEKDKSRVFSIKKFFLKEEEITFKLLENIFQKENSENENKSTFRKEDLFSNLFNIDEIKNYERLKFLEKLIHFNYKHEHYFFVKNNNLIIITINKDFEIFRTYVEDEDELIKLISNNYNPSLIYFYEVYKKEKENNNDFYHKFPKKEPDKIRWIYAPNDNIKKACKFLLLPLNSAFNSRIQANNFKSNQFAYIKNKSIVNNADIHSNNKHIIKFDIKSFFDYCYFETYEKYLNFLFGKKYSDKELYNKVRNSLKDVIVNPETKGLYMGNPVSGVLSNMIMHPVMIYIQNILISYYETYNIKISCSIYADDITFSTNNENCSEYFNVNHLRRIIITAFQEYNLPFKLKKEKIRKQNNQKRKITGVRINHNDQNTIERNKYLLLKSMLHRLSINEEITIPLSTLQGRISFYLYIDKTGKVLNLINKYKDVLVENGITLPNFVNNN